MEEDDDVIVEGTSLYNHLQDAGFTDFEVISSHNRPTLNRNGKSPKSFKQFKEIKNSTFISKKDRHGFGRRFWPSFIGMHNVEDNFVNSVSMEIIQTKLLQESDLMILELLSPTVSRLASDPHNLDALKSDQAATANIADICCVNLLMVLTTIWCSLIVVILSLKLVWEIAWIYCLGFSVFVSFLMFVLRWNYLRNFNTAWNALKHLLRIVQDCTSLSSKSLQFLNELSIIRRGLARKDATPEESEFCYESGVAEGLYDLLESLSSVLHSGHSLVGRTVTAGLDDICEAFAGRFEVERAQDVKDASLFASLKMKRNLVKEQISAYLVELLFCFEYSEDLSILHIIPPNELKNIENRLKFLERRLSMSKKFWLREESKLMNILKPAKSFERVKFDVVGAVDALSVHCRILAYSGMYLKRKMEEGNEENTYEEIERSCDKISNEILSCGACLEEVLDRAKCLLGEAASLPMKKEGTGGLNTNEEQVEETRHAVKLYGLEDPVIEDEVFEAVADSHAASEFCMEDEIWFESVRKERRVKRKQKERWRRLLQEVQPILQQRREMWQEREAQALRRKAAGRETKQQDLKLNGNCVPPDFKRDSQSVGMAKSNAKVDVDEARESGDSGVNSPVDECREAIGASFNCTEIDKTCKVVNSSPLYKIDPEECDSEEERLLLYRRVRKELDEDEARRGNETDDGSDSESENGASSVNNVNGRTSLILPQIKRCQRFPFTKELKRNEHLFQDLSNSVISSTVESQLKEEMTQLCPDEIDFESRLKEMRESLDIKEEKTEQKGHCGHFNSVNSSNVFLTLNESDLHLSEDPGPGPLMVGPELESQMQSIEPLSQNHGSRPGPQIEGLEVGLQEDPEPEPQNQDRKPGPQMNVLEVGLQEGQEPGSQKEDLLSGPQNEGFEAVPRQEGLESEAKIESTELGPQKENPEARSQTTYKDNFSCGESSSDDERIIDWSSCGFTDRRSLDDKVTPVGITIPGLPSIVSSEMQQRVQVLGGDEEVFGGVGEGASETESEDDDDSES